MALFLHSCLQGHANKTTQTPSFDYDWELLMVRTYV